MMNYMVKTWNISLNRAFKAKYICVILSFFALGVFFIAQPTKTNYPSFRSDALRSKSTVVYIYSGNDELYGENLEHFVQNGIKLNDGNDYYLVLQQDKKKWTNTGTCSCTVNCPKSTSPCECKCPLELKMSLPANVKLVYHENRCFDLGTFGELLERKLIDLSNSQYVIIMNSSIRGPFLPIYLQSDFRWTDAFTAKIRGLVKLVGPSISCGTQPHVQSFLVATDMVGLEILRKEGALKCYDTQADAVKFAELGASAAMFKHGYSIDSLMLKYSGVDWRDKSTHLCNGQMNPGPQFMYDGTTMNPLETLFVKVKALHADARWANVVQAQKYSEWSKLTHEKPDPNKNDFTALKAQMIPKIKASIRQECFDFEKYRNANYDLKGLNWNGEQLYTHYISDGYFEARPGVKLKC